MNKTLNQHYYRAPSFTLSETVAAHTQYAHKVGMKEGNTSRKAISITFFWTLRDKQNRNVAEKIGFLSSKNVRRKTLQ